MGNEPVNLNDDDLEAVTGGTAPAGAGAYPKTADGGNSATDLMSLIFEASRDQPSSAQFKSDSAAKLAALGEKTAKLEQAMQKMLDSQSHSASPEQKAAMMNALMGMAASAAGITGAGAETKEGKPGASISQDRETWIKGGTGVDAAHPGFGVPGNKATDIIQGAGGLTATMMGLGDGASGTASMAHASAKEFETEMVSQRAASAQQAEQQMQVMMKQIVDFMKQMNQSEVDMMKSITRTL